VFGWVGLRYVKFGSVLERNKKPEKVLEE